MGWQAGRHIKIPRHSCREQNKTHQKHRTRPGTSACHTMRRHGIASHRCLDLIDLRKLSKTVFLFVLAFLRRNIPLFLPVQSRFAMVQRKIQRLVFTVEHKGKF